MLAFPESQPIYCPDALILIEAPVSARRVQRARAHGQVSARDIRQAESLEMTWARMSGAAGHRAHADQGRKLPGDVGLALAVGFTIRT